MSRAARPSSLSPLPDLCTTHPVGLTVTNQSPPLPDAGSFSFARLSSHFYGGLIYLMQSIYLGHLVGREMGDRVPGADPCPSGEAGGLLLP